MDRWTEACQSLQKQKIEPNDDSPPPATASDESPHPQQRDVATSIGSSLLLLSPRQPCNVGTSIGSSLTDAYARDDHKHPQVSNGVEHYALSNVSDEAESFCFLRDSLAHDEADPEKSEDE